MNEIFYEKINLINNSHEPLKLSWVLSLDLLNLKNAYSADFQKALFENIEQLYNSNEYHNHYHLADVMFCCAYLLKYELDNHKEIKQNAITLLLSALFHDAGHLGRNNKFPYELENLATEIFKDYSEKNNLSTLWDIQLLDYPSLPSWEAITKSVSQLIKSTEFEKEIKQVKNDYLKNYEVIEGNIKINVLKAILVESDILLSVLPETGKTKTRKVMNEHALILNEEELQEKWIKFLNIVKNTHYYTKAAKELHIQDLIEKNINCSIIDANSIKTKNKL